MPTEAVAILTSIIRPEEKAIFQAFEGFGISFDKIDVRSFVAGDEYEGKEYQVIINRSIGQTAGLHAVSFFESQGVQCVNSSNTISVCGNKALTAMAFGRCGIPTPRWRVASSCEAALKAITEIGFPAVIKPIVGSWGRLVAKVDDLFSAESIIEHKNAMPGSQNKIFFIQEYIETPGRDLRAISVNCKPVAAYTRHSEHWKSNVKLGAMTEKMDLDLSLSNLVENISQAMGGGFLSIDILECPKRGLLVNEVNHTPEFMGAVSATKINIAEKLAAFVKGI